MKKLLVLVVLLLLIGLGWYMSRDGNNVNEVGSMKENVEEATQGAFTGTMAAAVKLGAPFKCTYSVDGVESEGYIKGKNYRGTMMSPTGEKAEIIMKDNCMWSWSENGQGMTSCYDPGEAEEMMWSGEEDQAMMEEAADLEESTLPDVKVEYNCAPAIISDDMFVPPDDVTFMDLQEVFKSGSMPNLEQFNGMMNEEQ